MQSIANEYVKAFARIINYVVGYDTQLADNISIQIDESNYIASILVDNYIEYINSGRRKRARKVPIDKLYDWARRRNIPTDNNTLYAIQQTIYRDGIQPRPILNKLLDIFDDNSIIDNNLDKIMQAITNQLDNYFNK